MIMGFRHCLLRLFLFVWISLGICDSTVAISHPTSLAFRALSTGLNHRVSPFAQPAAWHENTKTTITANMIPRCGETQAKHNGPSSAICVDPIAFISFLFILVAMILSAILSGRSKNSSLSVTELLSSPGGWLEIRGGEDVKSPTEFNRQGQADSAGQIEEKYSDEYIQNLKNELRCQRGKRQILRLYLCLAALIRSFGTEALPTILAIFSYDLLSRKASSVGIFTFTATALVVTLIVGYEQSDAMVFLLLATSAIQALFLWLDRNIEFVDVILALPLAFSLCNGPEKYIFLGFFFPEIAGYLRGGERNSEEK